MKIWHKFPMLRLLIPFVMGIILAISVGKEIKISILLFSLLFALSSLIVLLPQKFYNFRYRWLFGVIIFFFLLLFGFKLTIIKTPKYNNNNCSHLPEEKYSIITNVLEPPSEKKNTYKVVGKIVSIRKDGNWKKYSGKVLFYFKKDSQSKRIKYGDQLYINAFLSTIKHPQNPGEFNYRSYLQKKGIYRQAYIDGTFTIRKKYTKTNFLFRTAYHLRHKFFELLKNNNLKGDEYAVASALLLGYDEFLDSELKQDFAGAGAMHILCVSGLHVGIIYLVFSSIFFFLKKKKNGKIIRALILLLIIWFYALLTGLAPSVSRASTMISFIIIGKALQKESNIYNNLAASAFLLLVVNPYTITAVGFQLSYSAVVAILIIQPALQKLLSFNNLIGKQIWAITTVSVAAQIGTFPLSIYYFHQFPNYFILTNLIVIPISFLIIATGISLIAFSWSAFLSMIFSKTLIFQIYFLNNSVSFIQDLPNSTSLGISINTVEFFLIYIIIISLIIFFSLRKNSYFIVIIIAILFLSGINIYKNHKHYEQETIAIYNIKGHTAIDFIKGKEHIFLSDSSLAVDKNKLNFHVQNFRWQLDLTETKNIFINDETSNIKNSIIYKSGNYIQFNDKRLLLINNNLRTFPAKNKLKIKYGIISNNPKIKIKHLIKCYDIDIIIIDASNNYWNEKQWLKEAKEENIEIYSILSSGAKIIDF